jgi:NADH-quinone oxidoreductase subunit N
MSLTADWSLLSPEIVVGAAAILIFLLDAVFWPRQSSRGIGYICLCVSLIALCLELMEWNQEVNAEAFGGMYARDAFSSFFHVLLLGTTVLTVLLALQYLPRDARSEFYPLIMIAGLGTMVSVAATDLVLVYVGLELTTLSLCAICVYAARPGHAVEAAAKFYVMGALGSAVILYGGSLVYGAVGSTGLRELTVHLLSSGSGDPVLLSGLAFLVAGLCLKAAVLPFHMWAPDVRHGVSAPVAAFLSVAPGAAALAVLMRFLLLGFEPLADRWVPAIAVLATVTMVGGYLLAMNQRNLKRLLAYAFLAQGGFVLMGIAAANPDGVVGAVFQICVSALAAAGCYSLLVMCRRPAEDETEIGDYAGLAHRHPGLGFIFALLLLNLAGLPPSAGFASRFLLMGASAAAGQFVLVAAAGLATVFSAYVACRIIVNVYMRPASPAPVELRISPEPMAVLLLTATGTLALGLFPDVLIRIVRSSVVSVM